MELLKTPFVLPQSHRVGVFFFVCRGTQAPENMGALLAAKQANCSQETMIRCSGRMSSQQEARAANSQATRRTLCHFFVFSAYARTGECRDARLTLTRETRLLLQFKDTTVDSVIARSLLTGGAVSIIYFYNYFAARHGRLVNEIAIRSAANIDTFHIASRFPLAWRSNQP